MLAIPKQYAAFRSAYLTGGYHDDAASLDEVQITRSAVRGIFRMTMWNETIPDALRGRLASIEMVSYMSGPLLGNLEAGGVAAAFGVTASVVSGGVLCVAAVIACGIWLPRFAGYDARRFKLVETAGSRS